MLILQKVIAMQETVDAFNNERFYDVQAGIALSYNTATNIVDVYAIHKRKETNELIYSYNLTDTVVSVKTDRWSTPLRRELQSSGILTFEHINGSAYLDILSSVEFVERLFTATQIIFERYRALNK